MTRPTFQDACDKYLHRFTMQHVPRWALVPSHAIGKVNRYYAPQFRSDREWYEHTKFHGEEGHYGKRDECVTTGQTWPLGQWLDAPYSHIFATHSCSPCRDGRKACVEGVRNSCGNPIAHNH